MIKKILVTIVFIGITGVLIYGGINRTRLKSDSIYPEPINNSETKTETNLYLNENLEDRNGNGNGNNSEISDTEEYLEEEHTALPLPSDSITFEEWAASSVDVEWVEMTADVTSASQSNVYLQVGDTSIKLSGRSLRFITGEGFTFTEGDQLLIWAFDEEGDWEIGKLENTITGETVFVRDYEAHPLWAGGYAEE